MSSLEDVFNPVVQKDWYQHLDETLNACLKIHKITITPTDIIEAEYWQRPLHIAEKKGLPVKYKNVFDVKSIDFDWGKVEYVQYWVEPSTNEIVYYWKEKEGDDG